MQQSKNALDICTRRVHFSMVSQLAIVYIRGVRGASQARIALLWESGAIFQDLLWFPAERSDLSLAAGQDKSGANCISDA